MDLRDLATQLAMKKIGNTNDASAARSAVGDLLGGTDKFDLGALVEQFTGAGGGLADKAKSWLGDGTNDSISAEEVQKVLGADKVAAIAAKLGVSREEAGTGLSEMLPQLIDKASSGGNLLDSAGGVGRLAKLASKFFK